MNRNPLLLWGSSEGDGRSTQEAGKRESKAFSSSAWHVFPVHRMAMFIFFSSHRHQGVFSGCSFFQLLICPAVPVSRHGPARLESSAAGRHRSFRKSSFSFQAVPPLYSRGRTAPPSIRPSSKLSGPLERRTPNCLLIPRAPRPDSKVHLVLFLTVIHIHQQQPQHQHQHQHQQKQQQQQQHQQPPPPHSPQWRSMFARPRQPLGLAQPRARPRPRPCRRHFWWSTREGRARPRRPPEPR